MKRRLNPYINKVSKFLYHHVIAMRSSPHDLALGLAIGVFVGFLPIMGFQTIVSVPLAMLFRANKITGALGVWISNPVTFIPFYYFNFRFGRWLIGNPPVEWAIRECNTFAKVLELGWDILYPLWLGCIVLGIISIPAVYIASYRFIVFYQKKHNEKVRKSGKNPKKNEKK